MNSVELPVALPWVVFIIFWPLLGLLSVAVHALTQRRLDAIGAEQRSVVLFGLALFPIVAATLVAILGFAPLVGGLVVDSHCHAGTGCSPHVPILHMEIGHAIPVILGLVGLTGAVVLALFSRLKRGVMYGRALDAIADWAGEQQQQARQARDEHSASASLPRFKIIDSSKCFAYCTGLLRARLVVSRGLLASLSPAQLDAVLIHEQAHATRYDNLRLLLTTISLWPLPRSWSYALMRDLTSTAETVCDRKAAKRLGNVETVIDAISILSRARSATIKRSGSGFTHQSTVNEDAIELRIRALRRGPEDRLSDLALAGFALGAYVAIVMPSTYLAHHVVESVLGWLS